MIISNYNHPTPSFKAKFFKSKSLQLVAEYAVENGRFEELNQARKNIESTHLTARLRCDFGDDNGKPFVTFARYYPKSDVITPQSISDYKAPKIFVSKSSKVEDTLNFALKRLIKFGNNAANNNLYKKVVK